MDSKERITAALGALDPSKLTYQEWITVGMALKTEGFDCSAWELWSRSDERFRPGECERKWETFRGSPSPVTGGTVIRMAADRGAALPPPQPAAAAPSACENLSPSAQIILYLETLFEPDEFVGYVTDGVWRSGDGRWLPSKGVFNRTAGELIAELKRNGDDVGASLGDWKSEAGAWIRFNPLDGKGVRNENVTRFSYALVESDSMPVPDQEALYRELKLPVACLVHSGGRSLHAIVRVDAADAVEYRARVDFLYSYLERNGADVDRQNRNPSRLSRMPGVTRNGNMQRLVAVNAGCSSWEEWMEYASGADVPAGGLSLCSPREAPGDGLPEPVVLESFRDSLPAVPEELVEGVLRRGHKMLISGPSKAGKSFLLMELAISLAEGKPWLGFRCSRSRVLYVNLEIDPASCVMRFMRIYEALKWERRHMDDIVIWNLRGHAVPLDRLVPLLLKRMEGRGFDAVIIDPIYKVITGDENSATDMGYFCNQFDRICAGTGCSVIYCHHHSKGAQGARKAMDRASGSGVFARDPDAQLDMIELEMTDDIMNNVRDGNATAWRLECSLREFENFRPLDFWFEYPVHRIDFRGDLASCGADGSAAAVRQRNRKNTTPEERRVSIEKAYEMCKAFQFPVTVKAMAEYATVSERCIRDRIRENGDLFWVNNGVVGRAEKS